MRKIDRYIVRTVASAMFLVLAIVLALDLVFSFVAELDNVKDEYQVPQVLMYMLVTVPGRLYEYLPLAAFIGCLIGLGALANNSELVVVRAAGVSTSRISWSAMKPALVIVLTGVILGEYVIPHTDRIAESQKSVAQGSYASLSSYYGLWHREGNNYMHFRSVQANGVLTGLKLLEYDDQNRLRKSVAAERAIFQDGYWLLEDGSVTWLDDSGASRQTFSSRRWDSDLTPALLGILIVEPDSLSVIGLYRYADYLEQQGLDSRRYRMAFWKKVLRPLATAALVIVAISFIFGPLRSVTMGFRVFTGIVVGLLFKYVQDFLSPVSLVFGFSPIVASLTPILICVGVGVVLLRRSG